MIFYYFGGTFNDKNSLEDASNLEKHHFSGVMYTYDPTQGDMFVRAARQMDTEEKIKYLIAIRPYTISPQYLYAISKSINEIMQDRLQLNIVPGYIKDHEKAVGGIVGPTNDLSDSVDKSKYTIEFIKSLNEMSKNIENSTNENGNKLTNSLDFYVSITNNYTFETVKQYNNKIILPYNIYKRGFFSDHLKGPSFMIDFDIKNMDVMLAMTPIIRETEEELLSLKQYALRPIWKKGEKTQIVDDVEYFTYESFDEFIKTLEEDGINHLLINAVPRQESQVIIPFIKEYVESKGIK